MIAIGTYTKGVFKPTPVIWGDDAEDIELSHSDKLIQGELDQRG
jgi:hypothetical protein